MTQRAQAYLGLPKARLSTRGLLLYMAIGRTSQLAIYAVRLDCLCLNPLAQTTSASYSYLHPLLPSHENFTHFPKPRPALPTSQKPALALGTHTSVSELLTQFKANLSFLLCMDQLLFTTGVCFQCFLEAWS